MPNYTVTFLDWNRLSRDEKWNLSSRDPAVRIGIVRAAISEQKFRYRDQLTLSARDLDDVYRQLNDLNPLIHKVPRSLSVGDVISDATTEWVVTPLGFEPLW
jgi:hypothetical protein